MIKAILGQVSTMGERRGGQVTWQKGLGVGDSQI